MSSSLNYHVELEQVLHLREELLCILLLLEKNDKCELLFVLECGVFIYHQIALDCLIR